MDSSEEDPLKMSEEEKVILEMKNIMKELVKQKKQIKFLEDKKNKMLPGRARFYQYTGGGGSSNTGYPGVNDVKKPSKCSLCEYPFSYLPGEVMVRAVRDLRSSWGVTDSADPEKFQQLEYQSYDIAKVCVLCSQFFHLDLEPTTEKKLLGGARSPHARIPSRKKVGGLPSCETVHNETLEAVQRVDMRVEMLHLRRKQHLSTADQHSNLHGTGLVEAIDQTYRERVERQEIMAQRARARNNGGRKHERIPLRLQREAVTGKREVFKKRSTKLGYRRRPKGSLTSEVDNSTSLPQLFGSPAGLNHAPSPTSACSLTDERHRVKYNGKYSSPGGIRRAKMEILHNFPNLI